MYDTDTTFWYSQLLLNYIDKDYQTDGQLRLSISTNTKDYVSFNPVSLSVSITDTVQNRFKSTVLNIQNATDLFYSLKDFIDSRIPSQVLKKYNKGQDLIFDFILDNRSQERIVRISIRNNDSDFTKVIVSYFMFGVFIQRLKDFIEKYTLSCINLPNTFLLTEISNFIKSSFLSMKEKTLVSNFPPFNIQSKEETPEVKQTASTIEDLDKFIGGNEMTNIVVPELKEIPIEKPVEERSIMKVDSVFVNKFLFNDLSTLENELNACKIQKNGIAYFFSRIQPLFDFKLLDIDEKEYKSLIYTVHVLSQSIIRSYIERGISFPPSIPIIKCHLLSSAPQKYLELACDLLVFNAYIRSYRKRMESSISDALINGSMFYLLFRCFTDVFCFSVLDKQDPSMLSSLILKNFKYYQSIGVFKKYDQKLEEYGAQPITETEIVGFIEEIGSKVLNKSPYLLQLHDALYTNESLKLDINIDFSLEQIINEVVPLEVAFKLGYDITTLDFYKLCSEKVVQVFITKKKQKEAKKEEPTSNLFRLAKQYHHEVPEQYKQTFFELISKLEGNFDFNDKRFPLEEFGENIVKVLYCWNPETDPKVKTHYNHYFGIFENEIMTKDLILSKMKRVEIEDTVPWEEPKKEAVVEKSDWEKLFVDIEIKQ
jgi:hypothetical protein